MATGEMSAEEIRKDLQDRWRDSPALPLCLKIVDFVASLKADHAQMITFATLVKGLKRDAVDQDLLVALNILASTRIAALDTHAMLVDDDHSEHEIDPEELEVARLSGQLVHPETGEPVTDYESRVYPFFVPTERFQVGG